MITGEMERTGNTRKIYSLEQPVEKIIERVIQISMTDSHEAKKDTPAELDYSFTNVNRALMRGDPDSILNGEIRDKETAYAAVAAAETGHLVYGTLHVSNAIGSFQRLVSLGVSLDKLCQPDLIRLVMFQHLIPKVCPHCSHRFDIRKPLPKQYGELYGLKTYKNEHGKTAPLDKVIELKKQLNKDDSLVRACLERDLITSYHAVNVLKNIKELNESDSGELLKQRLISLLESFGVDLNNNNIRFKGDGCSKCFNGTIGVAPVSEVIVPDADFLRLIRNNQTQEAEIYWRSQLGGKTAVEDSYVKIVEGLVDPRTVERELGAI
jgi:type II secretory ATPase GspE/PulE/Tfp pilus assembly ATPase PilB-like protein